jgi:phosphoserine phosphatase
MFSVVVITSSAELVVEKMSHFLRMQYARALAESTR